MKILLIQHLGFINGAGGTEKICSFLANGLSVQGHEVVIATNENIIGKPFFVLNENIKTDNIYNPASLQKLPKTLYNYDGRNPFLWLKYKYIKKMQRRHNRLFIKKMGGEKVLYLFNLRHRAKEWKQYIDSLAPDLIITMSIGSVLEITYQNDYAIPIINSTNGRPDYDYTDILWYRSPAAMHELTACFKHLVATQVLFDSYKSFLPETFAGICAIISNPVPQISDNNIVDHFLQKERYKIIQIASLVKSKQQGLAIDIFSTLARQYPQWDLHFWGKGNDYNRLKRKIKRAGLQNRVFLMGLTKDPLKELRDADIFIFPSQFEGFPLALTEAMSAGLPVIGFKSCSGVNELIKHNETGFLADDKAAMQRQLEHLIAHPETRKRLGATAHSQMKHFKPDDILKKWTALINSVIEKK